MNIIDGKKIAQEVKLEIAKEVAEMIDNDLRPPHLVAVLVGADPASETYVTSKHKTCESVGMTSTVYKYPAEITEKELLEAIDFLNKDDEVDGFIIQLPLPSHISEDKIIMAIDPKKDVDGFHPINVGKMSQGLPAFLPATPAGIMELLKRYKIDTKGKHCVVLGRSNIVGTPVSILMSRKGEFADATVTICHSRTKNLSEITKTADIIIAAIGKPEFLKPEMVKDGVVIIDVGIHRIADETKKNGFRLTGDVDFEGMKSKASYITPVPGGVGPMTIISLIQNTLKASKKVIV